MKILGRFEGQVGKLRGTIECRYEHGVEKSDSLKTEDWGVQVSGGSRLGRLPLFFSRLIRPPSAPASRQASHYGFGFLGGRPRFRLGAGFTISAQLLVFLLKGREHARGDLS